MGSSNRSETRWHLCCSLRQFGSTSGPRHYSDNLFELLELSNLLGDEAPISTSKSASTSTKRSLQSSQKGQWSPTSSRSFCHRFALFSLPFFAIYLERPRTYQFGRFKKFNWHGLQRFQSLGFGNGFNFKLSHDFELERKFFHLRFHFFDFSRCFKK